MVERFDLERFAWNAPDRREVSGQSQRQRLSPVGHAAAEAREMRADDERLTGLNDALDAGD